MRGPRNALAAVLVFSAAFAALPSANAGESVGEALIGTWKPQLSPANDGSWAVLVFGADGRFAMLAARRPETAPPGGIGADGAPSAPVAFSESRREAAAAVLLSVMDAVGGSWTLGEDGGEVVLEFDGWEKSSPAWTRYFQLLLTGDELRPYPWMRGRSPLAATSWQKVNDGFGGRHGRIARP